MFAYCSNTPVSRIDENGLADYDFYDEDGLPGNMGEIGRSARGGAAGSEGQYQASGGGSGVTTQIQVGDLTISFGHGARHIPPGYDVRAIENAIAQDVVTKDFASSTLGPAPRVIIPYGESQLEYRAYIFDTNHIHVGTYFFTIRK